MWTLFRGNHALLTQTLDRSGWFLCSTPRAGPIPGRLFERRRLPLVMIFLVVTIVGGGRLFGGIDRWTSSGPGMAVARRVFADPFRPGKAIVEFGNTSDYTYARTARLTTDWGGTWRELGVPHDQGDHEIHAVMFDAMDPAALLVDMIDLAPLPILPRPPPRWRSTDGGATWSYSAELRRPAIGSRSVRGLIYGVSGKAFDRSTDGGKSWEALGVLPLSPLSLALSTNGRETIWVAGNPGVAKSTDGGWTWVVAGLAGQRVSLLAVAHTGGDVLAGDGTSLWRSPDGGASWSALALPGIQAILVDPTDGSTFYVASGSELYRSSDGGVHWEVLWTAGATDSLVDFSVSPGAPRVVLVTSRQIGLLKSGDGGVTWTPLGIDLRGSAFCLVPENCHQPGSTLYAGAERLYTSLDGGEHWQGGGTDLRIGKLAVAPAFGRLYAISSGSLWASNNRGASWQVVLQNAGLKDVRVAPSAHEMVYAASEYWSPDKAGVYRSRNSGGTWRLLRNGLPNTGTYALAVAPDNSACLLAASSAGLFRTDDSGEFWYPVGFKGMRIASVVFHPRLPGVAFVTAGSCVFGSSDAGRTWSLIVDLGETIGMISFDPESDDALYAASSSQVYRGASTGHAWVRFAPPQSSIYGLIVSGTPPTLHVATYWGVYSLTPSWKNSSDFDIRYTVSKVSPENLVTYTLRVTNRGPDDFVGEVKVRDVLPANVHYVSTFCPGWSAQCPARSAADVIFTHQGLFSAGETHEITITGSVAASAVTPTANVATVTPALPVDYVFSNNTTLPLDGFSRAVPTLADWALVLTALGLLALGVRRLNRARSN